MQGIGKGDKRKGTEENEDEPRRVGKETDDDENDEGENGLEGQRETPLSAAIDDYRRGRVSVLQREGDRRKTHTRDRTKSRTTKPIRMRT